MSHFYSLLKKYIPIGVSILLVALLALSMIYFVSDIAHDYASGELRLVRRFHTQEQENQVTVLNSLQPWMTFDYVNVVCKLPSDYLKVMLHISDPKYPNIRIDQYAKKNNRNAKELVGSIQQYIMSYKTERP